MCTLHAVTMLCGVCVTKLPDDFGNGSMRIQGLYVGTFIRNSIRVPEKFKQYRYLPVFFLSHTGTGKIKKNTGFTGNIQIPQT